MKTRTIILVCLCVLSILLNVLLLLREIEPRVGGGIYGTSPDKKHGAHAMSYSVVNPLHSDRNKALAELTIEGQDGRIIRVFRMDPSGVKTPMEYREQAKIKWSEDSQMVTFQLPGGDVSVRLNPAQGEKGP